MTVRLALPALCCSLALARLFAQTAEPPKPAPAGNPAEEKAPETPPDLQAYREAVKETDPEKKIAALEKWKADFPESNMKDNADSSILDVLVTKLPSQEARIRRFAASMYKGAEEKDKGGTAYEIAYDLLDANLMLKDAEAYAKKGLASMRLSSYLKEQLAGYEERKQKPPSSEELQNRFLDSRASRLAVLGRIELKLGQEAKGKRLLEESYAGNQTNGAVLSELALLALKAGDEQKAFEYLVPAKLSGRATKEAAAAFDTIYQKQHNGSLDGMEAMLDAEYNKRYPNPVKVDRYQPTAKRSDRLILAEVFTGSGCAPCAGADVAFDAAMERYSRKDVAVLMYHQHIPRPDPMTTVETRARAQAYNVTGVPTFVIDGKSALGGGPRAAAKSVFDRFNPDIEKELETPAEAHLTVGASLRDNSVTANVRVVGVTSESKNLKVQIALVEKELRFNGESGIRFHPMVVRSLKAFDLTGESYEQSFDLAEVSKAIKDHLDDYEAKGHRGETFKFVEKKHQIDRSDLAVVVFVQDDKTKHVLQAAYVDLTPESAHPTLEANNAK